MKNTMFVMATIAAHSPFVPESSFLYYCRWSKCSMPEVWTIITLIIYPTTMWGVVDLLHRVMAIGIVRRWRVRIAIITRLILIEALRGICCMSWRRSKRLTLRITAATISLGHLLYGGLLARSPGETGAEDAFSDPEEYTQDLDTLMSQRKTDQVFLFSYSPIATLR